MLALHPAFAPPFSDLGRALSHVGYKCFVMSGSTLKRSAFSIGRAAKIRDGFRHAMRWVDGGVGREKLEGSTEQ